MEIGIGDIVGGRDYLSGMTMTAPIASKIVTWEKGSRRIEYKLEDNLTVAPTTAMLVAATRLTKETEK